MNPIKKTAADNHHAGDSNQQTSLFLLLFLLFLSIAQVLIISPWGWRLEHLWGLQIKDFSSSSCAISGSFLLLTSDVELPLSTQRKWATFFFSFLFLQLLFPRTFVWGASERSKCRRTQEPELTERLHNLLSILEPRGRGGLQFPPAQSGSLTQKGRKKVSSPAASVSTWSPLAGFWSFRPSSDKDRTMYTVFLFVIKLLFYN